MPKYVCKQCGRPAASMVLMGDYYCGLTEYANGRCAPLTAAERATFAPKKATTKKKRAPAKKTTRAPKKKKAPKLSRMQLAAQDCMRNMGKL
jgi:hypothetical protein